MLDNVSSEPFSRVRECDQFLIPHIVQPVIPEVVQAVIPEVVQAVIPEVVQAVIPDVVQAVIPEVVVGNPRRRSGFPTEAFGNDSVFAISGLIAPSRDGVRSTVSSRIQCLANNKTEVSQETTTCSS